MTFEFGTVRDFEQHVGHTQHFVDYATGGKWIELKTSSNFMNSTTGEIFTDAELGERIVRGFVLTRWHETVLIID